MKGNKVKRRYIIRRLMVAIPTFLGITLLAFLVLNLAPGSPLDAMLADPRIAAEELERRRAAMGLDRPVLVQYFTWLLQVFRGNFGYSYSTQRPVMTMIMERLSATVLLSATALTLSLAVALPLGIYSAEHANSGRDYISGGISLLMMATPNFFAALILIYVFAIALKLLPSGGMYSSSSAHSFPDLLRHMIMPTLVLSFQQIGGLTRHMRSSMLEVMQQDYVRTARAKGLPWRKVIDRHCLRNALTPIVTVVGMSIPSFVGGAVITEQVFGWPGIGTLMVTAINARDYPVIMGITVFIAVSVLLANLLTDLAYGLIDPRISYQ